MAFKYDITSSITQLIDLSTAKSWLKIPSALTADDTIIELLIESAQSQLEGYTNRIFTSRDFDLYTNDIYSISDYSPYIEINKSPVNSISDFSVYLDGTFSSIPSASYTVELTDNFSRIYFLDNIEYDGDTTLPFKVSFNAGYTAKSDIKIACLQLISYNYENRGDVQSEGRLVIPKELYQVINKYRIISVI